MPSLLVRELGIGLGFTVLGLPEGLWTSALGAQLTWTLPFGLLAMFAVVARSIVHTRRSRPILGRMVGSGCGM